MLSCSSSGEKKNGSGASDPKITWKFFTTLSAKTEVQILKCMWQHCLIIWEGNENSFNGIEGKETPKAILWVRGGTAVLLLVLSEKSSSMYNFPHRFEQRCFCSSYEKIKRLHRCKGVGDGDFFISHSVIFYNWMGIFSGSWEVFRCCSLPEVVVQPEWVNKL